MRTNYLMGGLFLCMATRITISEPNVLRAPLTFKQCLYEKQQRIRNFVLRQIVNSDYKKIKSSMVLLHNSAKDTINDSYQELMNYCYDLSYKYYNIEENDRFVMEKIIDLLF